MAIDSNTRTEPIAIVGLAALMPKASSLAEFWANITDGVDCIEDVPASRWNSEIHFSDDPAARDKTYCRRGGFLPDIPFDPLEFGIPPNMLAVTDTAQLLALAVAKAAFADAGYPVLSGFDHARTAAILGVSGTTMKLLGGLSARLDSPTWAQALAAAGVENRVAEQVIANIQDAYPEWNEDAFPGFLANLVPGRIANRFDLGAASYAVDAACASSLCAIRLACAELASGACDLALTGGVDTDNSIVSFVSFSKTPALSRAQQVRPFDTNCDGTLIAEGIGMLVLKRLADAVSAGDRIYAVIRGMGASTDGRGTAIYVPRADGQVNAIKAALDQAGVDPATIGLIEAHGTGTPVGDEVELDGLMQTYGARSPSAPPVALGSVKSQIGHAKAAAGAAGMIKIALGLHRQVLPPTLGVTTPHSAIARDDSPFTLMRAARPWFSPAGASRRAAISAFGFGGANYHAVLEEFRTPAGANTTVSLNEPAPAAAEQAGLVAVFSGQGSQYVGMGAALAIDEEAFRAAVELMDRALIDAGEAPCSASMFPLWARTAAEAERQRIRLQQPLYAQAAVGAFSMGAFRLLREAGLRPACAIGHSFGELTALWSAGCFTDADFARLVVARGRSLSPPPGVDAGGLLAIRAPHDRVEAVLRDSPRLSIANLNAPAQTVIGGPTDAIDEAERACAATGIAAIRLQVAAAFHTASVEYARPPWRAALSTMRPTSPRHRVIANATAESYPDGADAIVDLLAEQPFRPVRFRDQVEAAYREGGRIFLEIGPRAQVAGLVDEILAGRPHQTIAINPALAGSASEQLAAAIERLRTAGISLRPLPHEQSRAVPADALPIRETAIRLGAAGLARKAAASPPSAARRPGVALADPPRVVPAPSVSKPPPARATSSTVAPLPAMSPIVPVAPSAAGHAAMDDVRHMQALLAEAHGLFLSGQAAIARALLEPGAMNNPAALALLRDVQDSGAALHERYLQDQADIARGLLRGAVAPGVVDAPRGADVSPDTRVPIAGPMPASVPAVSVAPSRVVGTAQPAAAAEGDTLQRLRAAVANATGYPLDFIAPTMDLEADLGIDSVKRMEILAGFRSGDLRVSAREFGRARTLGEIASLLGAAEVPAAAPLQAEAARPAEGASAGSAPDIDALLGRIVSEKTGYPADVLLPTMSLEADLGIDSIKRAEIVAAAAAAWGIETSSYAKAARGGTTLADLAAFLRAAQQGVATDTDQRDAEPPVRSVVLRPTGDDRSGPISLDGVVVVGDDRASVDAIVSQLRSRRVTASAMILDNADEGEISRTLDIMTRETGRIGAAILLPPHRALTAGQPFRQTQAFIGLLRAIAPRLQGDGSTGRPARLLAATRLDGQLGFSGVKLDACEESGIHAAIKTARREWPRLLLQSLDVARDLEETQAAAALVDALLSADFGADDIGVTTRGRHRLTFEPALPGARRRSTLERDALVLFSGGGRGIGALCAASLARETQARLLIVGRTPFSPDDPDWAMHVDSRELRAKATGHLRSTGIEPNLRDIEHACRSVEAGRELRESLARIRQHCAGADYLCVDIAERAKLAEALADATARHGPITGIVHAAGVLADRRIEDIRPGDVERVFQPKVAGLSHLMAAVDPVRLTRIALFSSTAGSFGNEGQAVYAMANQVLNAQAFALARQLPAARVVAIDWGPWRAGMVNDDIAARFEKKGVGLLSPEMGCSAFLDLFLGDQRGAFQFVVGDLPPGSVQPAAPEQPGYAAFREIA